MTFNVDRFKGYLEAAGGPARNNKFRVRIYKPKCLQPGSYFVKNNLTTAQNMYEGISTLDYFIEAASIPGVSHNTHEIRRYGYGSFEKRPYATSFTDFNCQILFDNKRRNYDFLQIWMSAISNYNYQDGIIGSATTSGLNTFEIEYKDNYMTNIDLDIYDEADNNIAQYRFIEAYPIFIGDMPLNWGDTNNILRIPVTFTYYSWYSVSTATRLG